MSHTSEPWIADDSESTAISADFGGVKYWIADFAGFPGPKDENGADNRDRAVACVNACAGSPTDALEEMQRRGLTFGQLAFLHARLQQQRDELLAALDVALENLRPHGDNCFVSDHYEGDPGSGCNCGIDGVTDYLISTIASVKGGAA